MRPLQRYQVGEHAFVVIADVDGDPGLLLERGRQPVGGLLMLAAVHGDRPVRRIGSRWAAAGEHPGPQRTAGDGGREHASPPRHEAAPEYMAVIAQATPGSAVLRFVIYPFLVIVAASRAQAADRSA